MSGNRNQRPCTCCHVRWETMQRSNSPHLLKRTENCRLCRETSIISFFCQWENIDSWKNIFDFLPGFRFYFSFIFRFIFRFLYSGCFFPPGTRCFFAESGGKKKRKRGEGREEKSGTGNKMILPMSLSNGYLAGLFSEQDSEEQLLS